MSETLGERLAFRGYQGAEWLATHLPERLGLTLFRTGGRLAYLRGGTPREVVAANLAQVLGRPADSGLVQAATREAFDRYARYWHETFLARVLPDDVMESRTTAGGWDLLMGDLQAGTGCLLVSPHKGNWDAIAHYGAVRGLPVVTVVEALRPERLKELFLRHRLELGMEVLVLEDGADVAREIRRHLEANHVVPLVADRVISGKGITVTMFGAERLLPAGPAMLSLTTGAPLRPISVSAVDGRWSFRIGEALTVERSGSLRADVEALTGRMAEAFERDIASDPTDWHMFQPAWPPR